MVTIYHHVAIAHNEKIDFTACERKMYCDMKQQIIFTAGSRFCLFKTNALNSMATQRGKSKKCCSFILISAEQRYWNLYIQLLYRKFSLIIRSLEAKRVYLPKFVHQGALITFICQKRFNSKYSNSDFILHTNSGRGRRWMATLTSRNRCARPVAAVQKYLPCDILVSAGFNEIPRQNSWCR